MCKVQSWRCKDEQNRHFPNFVELMIKVGKSMLNKYTNKDYCDKCFKEEMEVPMSMCNYKSGGKKKGKIFLFVKSLDVCCQRLDLLHSIMVLHIYPWSY